MMKYRLVSLFSILFGTFLLIVVAAARFAFYVSTISFQTNGATPIQSLEIQAGDALNLPTPSREGYTFGGWYLDPEFQQSANFLVLTNQNRTLYAYWIANLYTVTFDSNGGTSVDPLIQPYDSEIVAPEQPSLLGYDFNGWFLDDETFLEPFVFDTMPLSTTVYAKWTATIYDITYILNGGVLAEGSPLSYTIEDDLVVFRNPTREGHTFEGWFDNAAFDGDAYVAINPNRLASLTLYASWTVNQYTIIFDANGGSSVSPITQDYGTPLTEPEVPVKQGHTFKGWLNNGDLFTFTTMPEGGAYLVASWEINTYTITLNVAGGDALENSTVDVEYDATITLVTPTRRGYQFNSWTDGTRTWQTGDRMPDTNITLTAVWTLINYPITYVMDFGFNNEENPLSYTVLDTTITLLTPTKEGHSFIGWFSDAAFTTPITTIAQGSIGALTIYAQWNINSYEVTLDVNEGEDLTTDTYTLTFATILNLPIPVRPGYNFLGWKDAEGVTYSNGNLMPAKDLDLVAQWAQKIYQVKYYLFEADVTNPIKLPAIASYTLGQVVTQQEVPNPGYIFNGWFDVKTDEPFIFGFNMPDVEEPYVVYGKWTPIVYTVTYVLNDDVESSATNPVDNPTEFTVEDSIPLVAPSRPGYTFSGWQSDSVTVSSVGGAVTDITLTATWQLIRYDITYDTAGGVNNFDNPRNFNIEESFTLLPATRVGYTFGGWRNQSGVIMTEIPVGTSGNLTLTAQWTINSHTLSLTTFEGQTPTTQTKQFGATLGMATPTRRGYTFTGWVEVDTFTSYNASSTMPDRSLTLIGTWVINDYSIAYTLNGGTNNGSRPTSYTVLDAIVITSPTKTGATFVGWDKTGNGTADHFPVSGTTTITAGLYVENLTLRAIWNETQYTLTYNSDGGSAVASKTFVYNQSLDASYFPVPTKVVDGVTQTFVGWFDSLGQRWSTSTFHKNIAPASNLTLTARWASFPRSITYDPANGENTYSTSVLPGSNVYIGFTPYYEGYRFIGWMDEEEGIYYTADSIMPNKDLTLTAQWELLE
jgi:uncharacterized repeat protein (TIGR02543 family)